MQLALDRWKQWVPHPIFAVRSDSREQIIWCERTIVIFLGSCHCFATKWVLEHSWKNCHKTIAKALKSHENLNCKRAHTAVIGMFLNFPLNVATNQMYL